MADIRKLAGTFNAARVRSVVMQNRWDALRERLNRMGSFPSVHDLIRGNVYFQALIPLLRDFVPGCAPQDFTNVAHEFGVTILSTKEVRDLTCPPPPEPCLSKVKFGKCPDCYKLFHIIGPIADAVVPYVMSRHFGPHAGTCICTGSGVMVDGPVEPPATPVL